MKTKIYQIKDESDKSIDEVGELLRSGALAAIPTETVYGLAANALDPQAVSRIFEAKGRPQDNPLIVHISSFDEIYPLVKEVPDSAKALADKFWPGPLTIILKKTELVPSVVSAGLDTVAVRMPSHPIARAIIRAAGVPLAAPSANSSGLPSPTRASHVIDDMDGKIEAIVDSGACGVGVESTVVSLAVNPPRLLRPGGITHAQLESVLGRVDIDDAVTNELEKGAVAASPGMKYKHYSPKAQVYIVKGSFRSFRFFTDYTCKDSDIALCFDGEEKLLNVRTFGYGGKDKPQEQAYNLFDLLRKADKLKAQRVFVRCPDSDGVGLAVYNRLIRAAAFKIIELPEIYGLTGRTGSGKSTVAQELLKHGFGVIDCDKVARRITEKGSPVLGKLAECFGDDIILSDGTLDRKKLASRAFADSESTEKLNALTHPAITDFVMNYILQHLNEHKVFVIDAAVIQKSKMIDYCSKLIVVTADDEVCIERIMKRDSISREKALERINAQPSEQDYEAQADIIIKNNGGELDLTGIL